MGSVGNVALIIWLDVLGAVAPLKASPVTGLDILKADAPLVAALVAVSGVIGTIIFTNRRGRDRQEHERLLAQDRQSQERLLAKDQREHERLRKDAELDAERDARLRDERIVAYRKLLAATIEPGSEDAEKLREIRAAVAEIELLTSSDRVRISHAAVNVWAQFKVLYLHRERWLEDQSDDSLAALQKAISVAVESRQRFLKMSSEDLHAQRPRLQDEEARKYRERAIKMGREELAREREKLQGARPQGGLRALNQARKPSALERTLAGHVPVFRAPLRCR